jgi:hypothetical protein
MAVKSNYLFTDEAEKKPKKFKRCEACVPKTGQTTSYAPGDDGDLQMGIPWSEPRFIDNGDGTVTDNMTALMWAKDGAILPYFQYDWYGALVFCNDLNLAGYDDWRMPNVREMQSLVDYEMFAPALPDGHPFENMSDRYWTSTTFKYNPNIYALAVHMYYGKVWEIWKEDLSIFVLPVRGGK